MYEIFERLLLERGVSVAEVSRMTGVSQTALSNWKVRGGSISAKNAAKIANYFNVSVAFLMGIDDQVQKTGQQNGYYVYGETAELAQELFENRDMRALLDAARDVRPEDLRVFADLLKRYKQTNPDG